MSRRARNPITSRNEEEARASYERTGLCYVCGMRKEICLHVWMKNNMDAIEYAEFMATDPNYDALRIKRQEIQDARARRDRFPEPRITTGMLSSPADDPDTASEAHAAMIGDVPLNEMTQEQQAQWFANTEERPF